MESIHITLREGRTEADVYADAAISSGYSPTVTEDVVTPMLTETEKDNFAYPVGTVEDSKTEEQFTQPDGTIMYTLSYTVETANPITEEVFGREVVRKSFGRQDADIEGKAATLRAKSAYGE